MSASANPAPVFFFSAAEHSGDALGAAVIPVLARMFPGATFVGVGGHRMAGAGLRLLADPVSRSAMGMSALVRQTRYWWSLLKTIDRELAATRPAVVVPIDSSAVNLRVAKLARARGIPVCYYVAPQLWASRPWRVAKLRAVTNTVCCVLPFEEAYFRARGVHAVYVGHPMFDTPAATPESDPFAIEPPLPGISEKPEASAAHAVAFDHLSRGPRIAVLPGSRSGEIDANLPPMLEICAEIKGRYPRVHFVAVAPSDDRAWQIRHYLRRTALTMDIRTGISDAVIRWADFCLTKSGTAVLQIARHHKPMVAVYRVPAWQWHLIGRHLIHTRYITLVNILANRELIPEHVPFTGSPLPVARQVLTYLAQPQLRQQMSNDLAELVKPLSPQSQGGRVVSAAERVAREVAALLAPPAPGKPT